MTQEEIKEKVDNVFRETELLSIPLEIVSLANYYGFGVYSIKMDDRISGMIAINKNGIKHFDENKVIVVNANHSIARKRFTVAHEIGHYILEGKPEKYYAHRDTNGKYNDKEKNANRFASELLMPEEDIRNFVENECKNRSDSNSKIMCVANRYSVSESAAQVRLKTLHLIGE